MARLGAVEAWAIPPRQLFQKRRSGGGGGTHGLPALPAVRARPATLDPTASQVPEVAAFTRFQADDAAVASPAKGAFIHCRARWAMD